eukprot:226679-Chlamydomonas_euryale.AAC.1
MVVVLLEAGRGGVGLPHVELVVACGVRVGAGVCGCAHVNDGGHSGRGVGWRIVGLRQWRSLRGHRAMCMCVCGITTLDGSASAS